MNCRPQNPDLTPISNFGWDQGDEKVLRCDDRDAPEWVECQKVGVTTDDVTGTSADRQFQKFIVLRVAAFFHRCCDRHHLGLADKRGEEFETLLPRKIFVEFGSAQHLIQFGHRFHRDQQAAAR